MLVTKFGPAVNWRWSIGGIMSLGDVEQIVNCPHYSKHRAEALRPLMFQFRIWQVSFGMIL